MDNNRELTLKTLTAIRRLIREHRDQIGDYRCWVDDEVLYHAALPELDGSTCPLPDPARFSDYCQSYYDQRQNPNEPISDILLDSSVGPLLLHYPENLDSDLTERILEDLQQEIEQLQKAIRLHRAKGPMKRTYQDDADLYLRLPEKRLAITRLPARSDFLGKNCPAYNAHCQQHPEEFSKGIWTPSGKNQLR